MGTDTPKLPAKTIAIDWAHDDLLFRDGNDEVRAHVREPRGGAIDRFQLCCAVAVVQHHHMSARNPWRGADDSFLDSAKTAFGWGLDRSSLDKYWRSYLPGGRKYVDTFVNGSPPGFSRDYLRKLFGKVPEGGYTPALHISTGLRGGS